jgi:hypothetical protein
MMPPVKPSAGYRVTGSYNTDTALTPDAKRKRTSASEERKENKSSLEADE